MPISRPNTDKPASALFTLEELATHLKVSPRTIQRMVQAEEIPAIKIGGQWRFLQNVIADWLAIRTQLSGKDSLTQMIATAPKIVPLSRLITPERIVLGIAPGSKRDVLAPIVDTLVNSGIVEDREAYIQRLLAREEMVTTAVGAGVAFPHVREPEQTAVVRPCIAIGICPDGTDFQSLDDEPTYVFTICCSASEVVHLRLLAKLSLLFRQQHVVPAMRAAVDSRDVMRLLIKADSDLTASF